MEGSPHRWLLYHPFLHDLSFPLQCIYLKGAATERIRKGHSIRQDTGVWSHGRAGNCTGQSFLQHCLRLHPQAFIEPIQRLFRYQARLHLFGPDARRRCHLVRRFEDDKHQARAP